MVGYQVLPRCAQVHRIPVGKVASNLLDSVQRYSRNQSRILCRPVVQEDVLEELRRQLIDLHPGVDVLGQDVVGHVDGRVAQGLNQPLLVPGQVGAQALPAGTGLVLQPVNLVLELHPDLLRNEPHPGKAIQNLSLPLRIGVLQEPLVPHHHDHAARPAAADDRRL